MKSRIAAALAIVLVGLASKAWGACGTLPNLTPSVLALSWSDAAGFCTATSCPANDDVTFAVQAFGIDFSCATYTFTWNFGDGTTLTTSTPAATHRYTGAGAYTVTVHIARSDGQQLDLTRTLAIAGAVPMFSTGTLLLLALSFGVTGLVAIRRIFAS